jgi:CRISPR-associated exonuclease Cas4
VTSRDENHAECSDADLCPLSALNHLLFCARRCALIHIEGVWAENAYTLEGSLAHKKVHKPESEDENTTGRLVRGLWLRSNRLRLVGVADLVEFRPEPYPIEYKRGRRRRWDNDDVQLCAQALCLEEMLRIETSRGAIFHVRSRRRREIEFDSPLRRKTEDAVAQLHALVKAGRVPPPVLHRKCKACSLRNLCMPELITARNTYERAAQELFIVEQ